MILAPGNCPAGDVQEWRAIAGPDLPDVDPCDDPCGQTLKVCLQGSQTDVKPNFSRLAPCSNRPVCFAPVTDVNTALHSQTAAEVSS